MPQIPSLQDGSVVNELHWADLASAANNTQTQLFGNTSRSTRPMFSAFRETTSGSLTAGDWFLTWTTGGVQLDTASMWTDVAPQNVTIPITGHYRVSAAVNCGTAATLLLIGTVNAATAGATDFGSKSFASCTGVVTTGSNAAASFTRVRKFNAGDFIKVGLYLAGSGTIRGGTEWGGTSLSVEFIAP